MKDYLIKLGFKIEHHQFCSVYDLDKFVIAHMCLHDKYYLTSEEITELHDTDEVNKLIFPPLAKVRITLKKDFYRIQNGRIIGYKNGQIKIQPLGVHFQELHNSAKCFWVNPVSTEISLNIHRLYKKQ